MAIRHAYRVVWAAVAICVAGTVPAQAPESKSPDDLKSQVPALIAFHEVIFPLWHEAWPNKNVQMMKDLLPRVRLGVAEIRKAVLPGILRDRQPAWNDGVSALEEAAKRYETAAAGTEEKPLLDAVEELHSRFERLVRVVRPAMKELDAYHVALYRVYHEYTPARRTGLIRQGAEEMASRCKELLPAPVPRRLTDKEAAIRAEFSVLCAATEELREAAKGDDEAAIVAAVNKVHSQYQRVDKLFE